MTDCQHTAMAAHNGTNRSSGHIAWEAQAAWFRSHGYRIQRCPACFRFAIVVAEDGRRIDSFTAEVRRLSMLYRVSA